MNERVIQPLGEPNTIPSSDQIEAGRAEAEHFISSVGPQLGRLLGVDLNLQLGDKWATVLNPGVDIVTVDPSFFIEKGYTADMTIYATLHEAAAHYREKVTNPKLTDRILAFIAKGGPQDIFHNIFADIAGNNLIHAVLPRMKGVAKQLYGEKLFPETDYTKEPRHIQFLYKIIREEMIPDSETTVLPEVDEAIASLRDYQGKGDLIKYSTAIAKSSKIGMTGEERFALWKEYIYPVYNELLKLDRKDPDRQDSQKGDGKNESSGEPGDQQSSEPSDGDSETEEQDASNARSGKQTSDDERFKSFYDDYRENKHPDPLHHDEEKKLHDHAKEKEEERQRAQDPEQIRHEQERKMDEKLREETGHSIHELNQYNAEVTKWQSVIQDMRDVYQQVINRRVAEKRKLSHIPFTEGAVLASDQLVQTYIDVRNLLPEPEAFLDYVSVREETAGVGQTDWVFLGDISNSMKGDKAQAACSSMIIGLEGLAAMQRDIDEAELETGLDLDLDIRTAMYTFGYAAHCIKPLSSTFEIQSRLDMFTALQDPSDGATTDYLALEELLTWEEDRSRKRIIIVYSDGGSFDGVSMMTERTRENVLKLREKGWLVFGVSIGSDLAEELYAPTSKQIYDPKELPSVIQSFIETTIT